MTPSTPHPGPGSAQAAPADDRRLAANGLPGQRRRTRAERVVASFDLWFIVALAVVVVLGGVYMWLLLATDFPLRGDIAMDMDRGIIARAARTAVISAIPLTLVWVLCDRWRPHRVWIWVLALAWGGLVATPISYEINTWMAAHLNVVGQLNPAAQARPAIFVAPFVEEAAKATVLFWVAMAMRNRWIGLWSGISLAGLSGVGFAFVENILYYGRALLYASQNPGITPDEALRQIFLLRGVMTAFAHPLFTSMTGIGLAVALRTRSKTVRVIAPLTGFCCAALLHMLFNGMATIVGQSAALYMLLLLVAYPLLSLVLVLMFRTAWNAKHLVRARLADFEKAGWLPASEVAGVSEVSKRVHAVWQALWAGRLVATVRMHHTLTELAFVRDAMLRGLIDAGGTPRVRELLARAVDLRARAIVMPWPRTSYPWERRRSRRRAAQLPATPLTPGALPAGALPAGAAGGSGGFVPVGGPQYSPVDPTWKPPS